MFIHAISKTEPENLAKVESLEELDLSGTAIRQRGSSIFLLTNVKAIYFRGCEAKRSSTSRCLRFPENVEAKKKLRFVFFNEIGS